jgi:cytochrome c peroxidase
MPKAGGLVSGGSQAAYSHSRGPSKTRNQLKDIGRGEWLKIESMQHAFKTPTLRDADRRGPYMHDGSVATLADVVDQYDHGGVERPSLSDEIRPLHLTAAEKHDLVAFLCTLTATNAPVILPVLPNPQDVAE